jgi:DNA ligase-like protein
VKRFAALHRALDETKGAAEREALLVGYFREAPVADAACAASLLAGPRPRRAVSPAELRAWAAAAAALPQWMVEESWRAVGDLAESVAHLLENAAGQREWPLHRLVEERLLPLAAAKDEAKRALLLATWRELPADQHLVWNRLAGGTFRPLVTVEQVARARAVAAGRADAVQLTPPPADAPQPPHAHTVEAVLVYAQRGAGERSSHYFDYTFALWNEGELVPIAKTSGGLPPAEEAELDRWVRRNIAERFGPVRRVRPELVFELGFDGVEASSRHKAGLTLRAPRLLRWLRERTAEQTPTLRALRDLLD